jgi:hypothetical protein
VLIACVARNPSDYEQWAWSSYPGTVGLREPFSFVDAEPALAAFGTVAELRRLVDAWTPKPRDASLLRGDRPVYSERRMATAPPPSAACSKPFRS